MSNRTDGMTLAKVIAQAAQSAVATSDPRVKKNEKPAFKMGTVPSGYTSGRPTLIWDGESSASTRTYPYLGSYTPAANDRVLVAMVGKVPVILGKIT